jgi:hypothetical protein
MVTDKEAQEVMAANRGRALGNGKWRNFCAKCRMPLEVSQQWLAKKTDLVCDDCRPAIQTGNSMSTAFSAEKKGGRQ